MAENKELRETVLLRPAMLRFADACEERLKANDEKTPWNRYFNEPCEVADRIGCQLDKLNSLIDSDICAEDDPDAQVRRVCENIGNYAMILHDLCSTVTLGPTRE